MKKQTIMLCLLSILLSSCQLLFGPINVTDVTISKSILTIERGQTYQLSVIVNPKNAENKAVRWSSSNQNIATVSISGLVTAVSIGSCVITVNSFDGNISDTCNITVEGKRLVDQRLNGDFSYYYTWQDSWGIDEDFEYTSLEFDGTNKAWYYTKYYSYRTTTGWTHSGDYIGDSYSWYWEFEVNNGLYRFKLWNNSYDDWNNWEAYSFSTDGNTLTLKNYYNIPGNDLILEKTGSSRVVIPNKKLNSGNRNENEMRKFDLEKQKRIMIKDE